MIQKGPISELIDLFSKMPGIGEKTADRLVSFIVQSDKDYPLKLSEALLNIINNVSVCPLCGDITHIKPVCEICGDEKRDRKKICVIKSKNDLIALERSGGFNGKYHILQGVISPRKGIGPKDIRLKELKQRVEDQKIKEVIIALNADLDGDATSLYIYNMLKPFNIYITRLAAGVPVGSDLEYLDKATISRALMGRYNIS